MTLALTLLALIVVSMLLLGYGVARSERCTVTSVQAPARTLWYHVHTQDEISGE